MRIRVAKIGFRIWFALTFLWVFLFCEGILKADAFMRRKPRSYKICDGGIVFVGVRHVSLNSLEKTLLCGDPSVAAWETIPLAQKKNSLKAFLQEKGYYQMTFDEKGPSLLVLLGKPTRVGSIRVTGSPPGFDMGKRRQNIGTRLTPKFLNEIEKWTVSKLKSQGYPCPAVKTEANAVTGDVQVRIAAGERQRLVSVVEDSAGQLKPGIIRRFDAFRMGEWFDNNLLNLTTSRIQNDGMVQGTYSTATCEGDGAHAEQKIYPGEPRIVSVGFGANTEGLVLAKASWRHTRLGENASLFDVSGYGSYKKQEVSVSNEWYLKPARWYLLPILSFSHERESQFHFISGNIKTAGGFSWDNQSLGIEFNAGPNLNYIDTFRGSSVGLTRFLSFQYQFQLRSHDFEYYLNNPRSGYRVALSGDLTNKNLLSDVTAQRFKLDGQYLYNLLDFDLPLLVIGARGGLYGTFAKSDPGTLSELPPNYRFYLGGSQDLRGYSRQELPGADGSLSAAYASLEVRLANFLPVGIQPFVFADAGIFGGKALHFEAPLYYSPGFGLRYQSPIGMFRATMARGFKAGGEGAGAPETHWQYYVSFGEEF